MQALENKGRWSWVKTYPLWDIFIEKQHNYPNSRGHFTDTLPVNSYLGYPAT